MALPGVPRPTFNPEQVERGLLRLAEANGNAEEASRSLKSDGLSIDPNTLRRWRTGKHAERYEVVRSEVLPRLQAQAAEAHAALAAREMAVSAQMVERLAGEVDGIAPRDLSTAVRNLDVGAAIHRDKAQILKGEPTHIVRRSFEEIKRELKERGVVLDGIAVEEQPLIGPPSSASDDDDRRETPRSIA